MLELNQEINWVPDHIQDGQFGRWLENARDWSITRNRFWGSPVPVWKSDDPTYPRIDVYGSFEQIERDFGRLPRNQDGEPDLHRPYVDDLVRPNPDDPTGQSMMRRVADVLDVWFDSGSMSFAQVHVPVRERRDWFAAPLPGRLHRRVHRPDPRLVLHAAHPGHRDLRQAGVRELHQPRHRARLRRQQDVEVAAQLPRRARGLRPRRRRRDALVPDVVADPARRQPGRHRAGHPRLGAPGADPAVEQLVLLPALRQRRQAGRGTTPRASTASTDPLDRYLLAKCRDYVEEMTTALDAYAVADACDATRSFLDVLTNWYIRRSRDRFWGDNPAAFDTLYTVLEVVCRATAPLMPLTTEEVWRGLTGGRSVHLADWPLVDELPADDALVAAMDQVREVCSADVRAAQGRATCATGCRSASLTVVVDDPAALAGFEAIVARRGQRQGRPAARGRLRRGGGVRRRAEAHRQRPRRRSAAGQGRAARDQGLEVRRLVGRRGRHRHRGRAGAGGGGVHPRDRRRLRRRRLRRPACCAAAASSSSTPRSRPSSPPRASPATWSAQVQQARRDAGLDVSDRIALTIGGCAEVLAAARTHERADHGETLATSYDLVAATARSRRPGRQAVAESAQFAGELKWRRDRADSA